jgi:hypothetical protein
MRTFGLKRLAAIWILLFSFFIVWGCEFAFVTSPQSEPFSHEKLTEKQLQELIIGKWNWMYAMIMQRSIQPPNNKLTPESVGYTMRLEFDEHSKVKRFVNDSLIETVAYHIRRFKVLPTDEAPISVIYFNSSSAQLRFLHPDTVMIGNGWLDGIDDFYARIK